MWAEDSTEKEKDSVPTAVTIPVAPTVVNAAASTTTLTTTTAGTVSSTSEVRERRRCVKVLTGLLIIPCPVMKIVCFVFPSCEVGDHLSSRLINEITCSSSELCQLI